MFINRAIIFSYRKVTFKLTNLRNTLNYSALYNLNKIMKEEMFSRNTCTFRVNTVTYLFSRVNHSIRY